MRFVLGLAGALAAGVLVTSPLHAQEGRTASVGGDAAAQPAQPVPPPFETTFGGQVSLRAMEIAGRGADKDDASALRAYYQTSPDKGLWTENGRLTARALAVIAEIRRADDWGLSASQFTLPAETSDDGIGAEAQLTLAVLKYARHARGGRIDPVRLTESIDRTANLIEPQIVLEGIAKAADPDAYLRKLHPQHPQFERLRQLYLKAKAGTLETAAAPAPVAQAEPEVNTRRGKKKRKAKVAKPATPPPLTAEKLLVNMEQWRWMPDDLGAMHIQVNIPEFQLKVVKDGRQIHTERVVTGTTANKTPVFSKAMETVVFNPGWGVPPSIKVKELLPGLLAGRDPIAGRGLVVRRNGREVPASSINWRTVDIRRVDIVQPPGPRNALGMVKFLFPNKHDVYLHDTPSKHLFNASSRAFSHGCVRVRNPMRLAEVIFGETAGWQPQRVAGLTRNGGQENKVSVPGQIQVHLTYFTVTVDDDGTVHRHADVYGHEARIKNGFEGRYEQFVKRSNDLTAIRTSLVSKARSRTATNGYGYESAPRPRRNGGGGSGGWFLFGGF